MAANERKILRCAVYTRKSSEHGLEQDFNSLDAQREAAEAYIRSQAHEGWRCIKTHYDDGGLSGGTLDRPALQSLLDDIGSRKVDVVVVYKVDRLTRSLGDFAKLVELFEAHGVSFVAVTQQFNTTTSMGRLTLNVLLSFAQFERELAGERIRDKFAASRRCRSLQRFSLSTLTCWRSTRISASSRALDRSSPVSAHPSSKKNRSSWHEHHPIRPSAPPVWAFRQGTRGAMARTHRKRTCPRRGPGKPAGGGPSFRRYHPHRKSTAAAVAESPTGQAAGCPRS
jgi:DNA invertase Pin-like site-specific DNA recombinase